MLEGKPLHGSMLKIKKRTQNVVGAYISAHIDPRFSAPGFSRTFHFFCGIWWEGLQFILFLSGEVSRPDSSGGGFIAKKALRHPPDSFLGHLTWGSITVRVVAS